MENFNDCIRKMIGRLCVFTIIVIFISSCKNNTSDQQSGDRATIENASKNVMSIMGKTRKEAEEKILKAGFRKADLENFSLDEEEDDDNDDDFYAPKRLKVSPKRINSDDEQVCYVYNISKDMDDMEEEEIVNAIIDSKKTAIIFMAFYNNGILMNINGKMIVGAEIDNVNSLYLDCSSSLHNAVANKITAVWSGQVTDTENLDDDDDYEAYAKTYTDYNKFYNAVAPLNSVFANETAGGSLDLTGTKGFGYRLTWDKPNEYASRFQINNYYYKTAIAEAGFSITYIDYTNMDY